MNHAVGSTIVDPYPNWYPPNPYAPPLPSRSDRSTAWIWDETRRRITPSEAPTMATKFRPVGPLVHARQYTGKFGAGNYETVKAFLTQHLREHWDWEIGKGENGEITIKQKDSLSAESERWIYVGDYVVFTDEGKSNYAFDVYTTQEFEALYQPLEAA